MRHQYFYITLLAMFPLWGIANDVKAPRPTAPVYNSYCQEISVGWGDYQFESLAFHDSRQKGDYRYTGHLFAKYMYHTNAWFAFGPELDCEYVDWRIKRNEMGELIDNGGKGWFSNIDLLLNFRFTYYQKSVVQLYSGFSVGLNMNIGSEYNYHGHNTAAAFAFGINLLGVRVGNERVFGAVEIGGLNSLNNMHEIYMLGSRLFTASIGVTL